MWNEKKPRGALEGGLLGAPRLLKPTAALAAPRLAGTETAPPTVPSWTQRQVPGKEAEVLPPLRGGHTNQVLPMQMEAVCGCFHVNRVSSGAGWAREG